MCEDFSSQSSLEVVPTESGRQYLREWTFILYEIGTKHLVGQDLGSKGNT